MTGQKLSVWNKVFMRRPKYNTKENYVCVIKGREKFRLVSAMYRQNLYAGGVNYGEHPITSNLLKLSEGRKYVI